MTRADAVRAITAGRSVSLFTDKGKQPVFVFFAPRGQSGALFWCTLASALRCLILSLLGASPDVASSATTAASRSRS